MRLHNWEKWSDSDLLIWTASPENNAKIKPNIGPHSSYLHEATTHTHTQNWIISVAETWLLTLAMLSPLLCANKVIRIELGAADAQEELRKMLSRWNQWLAELIPCQRLQQLLGGIHHSGQRSSTAEAARQVSGRDSQVAEDQQVSEEGKGGPPHYQGLDRLRTGLRTMRLCGIHNPPQAVGKGEEAEKEDGREHSVIHNLFVTGRKSGLITHSQINGIFLLSPGRAGPLVPSPIKWMAPREPWS